MIAYFLRRVLHMIPVFIGVTCITFALMNLTPGDPAEIMLRGASGVQPSQEAIEAAREAMGLNAPVYKQYAAWLWRVLHLDLGRSYSTDLPVWQELTDRLPATLLLAMWALVAMLAISLPLGIGSALYPHSWVDRLSRIVAMLGVSMPGYWLGLLLVYYGSVKLKLFPVIGMDGFRSVVLPALTLGIGMAGHYIRVIRSGLVDVLGTVYIKAARAKGLQESLVIGRHALINALLPVLTMLGIHIGGLLSGSVIVETIFSWPGVGKFAVDAIFKKDFIVIQGYVLLMAVFVVSINLAVDLCYRMIDPRIRLR